MNEMVVASIAATWLGILTSISPCPLASNIAAMSFIAQAVNEKGAKGVFWSGILYTLGRAVAYALLGWFLVAGVLSVPATAFFLQRYMNQILGPVLILVGMVLLGLLDVSLGSGRLLSAVQQKINPESWFGPFGLGVLFALAFCPVSAALYFGSLLPMALKQDSRVLLPMLFGFGSALPVFGFAVLTAMGANSVTKAFSKLTTIESWIRYVTGLLVIGVGTYLSLKYVFEVLG